MTDKMEHQAFYGRDGLRLGGLPYLTVCQMWNGSGESTETQVQTDTRADGRTTDEALDEIARRWNGYEDMAEALHRIGGLTPFDDVTEAIRIARSVYVNATANAS